MLAQPCKLRPAALVAMTHEFGGEPQAHSFPHMPPLHDASPPLHAAVLHASIYQEDTSPSGIE